MYTDFAELNKDIERQTELSHHWKPLDGGSLSDQIRLGRAELRVELPMRAWLDLYTCNPVFSVGTLSVGGSKCVGVVPGDVVCLYFRGFEQEFLDRIADKIAERST